MVIVIDNVILNGDGKRDTPAMFRGEIVSGLLASLAMRQQRSTIIFFMRRALHSTTASTKPLFRRLQPQLVARVGSIPMWHFARILEAVVAELIRPRSTVELRWAADRQATRKGPQHCLKRRAQGFRGPPELPDVFPKGCQYQPLTTAGDSLFSGWGARRH